MRNRWSAEDAENFIASFNGVCSADVAQLVYVSRLVGAEGGLVLHGGGNSSVKTSVVDIYGDSQAALFVKASGRNMANLMPQDFCALDLSALLRLRILPQLSESLMQIELRRRLFDPENPCPSMETLAHAFLPAKYILHTHADAVMVLTNQQGGRQKVAAALGEKALVVPYFKPGFALAKAVANALEASANCLGMVWMLHGITTWGNTAEEAYHRLIDLVTLAEEYAERSSAPRVHFQVCPGSVEEAMKRVVQVAPIVRGTLANYPKDEGAKRNSTIVLPLVTPTVLGILSRPGSKDLLVSPPLTSDHLIRTKPLPLWIDGLNYENSAAITEAVQQAVEVYAQQYQAYLVRNAKGKMVRYDPTPSLIFIPGLGVLAAGSDMESAAIARDIAAQSLLAKNLIAEMDGVYVTPDEEQLFHMEYDPFQRAKLATISEQSMSGRTALVTGAAGAIGLGICEELLRQGCAVVLSDLPGERFTATAQELMRTYGQLVLPVPFDVTNRAEVASAFATVSRSWGGLDLVVINAGIAHVSQLVDLDIEVFRRLEQVNVEGTLHLLAESERHFHRQGCGGDVVLVSTKNVFAPGSGFGAYSATKAAAHQLARIASLELAAIGVRVNMVAPDGVFSHGTHRSGLWDTVGPARMRARGLDEQQLQSYYQNRNLLKVRITATDVAKAVIYFATRQTPTTGATIPVDGGLPDATPR